MNKQILLALAFSLISSGTVTALNQRDAEKKEFMAKNKELLQRYAPEIAIVTQEFKSLQKDPAVKKTIQKALEQRKSNTHYGDLLSIHAQISLVTQCVYSANTQDARNTCIRAGAINAYTARALMDRDSSDLEKFPIDTVESMLDNRSFMGYLESVLHILHTLDTQKQVQKDRGL